MHKTRNIFVLIFVIILILVGAYFLLNKKPIVEPSPVLTISETVHYSCFDGAIDVGYGDGFAEISLSDGRKFVLTQTTSDSGISFEKDNIAFMSKGDSNLFQENGVVTYEDCVVYTGTDNVAEESVFIDEGKTFSFSYPKEFIASTESGYTTNWRQNTQTLGSVLTKIIIPKSFQPSTNFSEAVFTVGASSEPNAIKKCLISQNGEISLGKVDIDDVAYSKITLSEGAAGSFYDTTSYRTLKNKQCYAVEYTIHSTNIGVYSQDQGIKEFDKAKIIAELESMVQSFQFLSADDNDPIIKEVTVTPVSVVEDSRCPEGTQCIWSGTVKVNVRVTNKNGDIATGVVTLDEPKTIVGVSVTLTEVLPVKTNKQLVFSDYKFKFSLK